MRNILRYIELERKSLTQDDKLNKEVEMVLNNIEFIIEQELNENRKAKS